MTVETTHLFIPWMFLGYFDLYVFVHQFCFIINLCWSSHYSHTGILAKCLIPSLQNTSSIEYNINIHDVNQTSSTSSSSIYLRRFIIILFSRRLLVPFDEPATFTNLALLITFTLALVQALLSLIGAVMSCLWSPCCFNSLENYTPITTHPSHAPTTSHRYEVNEDEREIIDRTISLTHLVL